ncbi:hypothetical protein [Phreatobacter stygius]|uniref:Uncharacterized protein n=1 Tax=Phreatobacter stygius TaxID=1940610 RepID=A0A4D7AZJ6_9HYPH|nr:hypothetical protein [Phreatobacter stygius]QCI63170.1 hypothetical protein E8M01_02305 [Phreatobacter stygius]
MTERLKVKFLAAIWGARYIEEFARVSIPSYLAEGNLPYVASETDLEILIMTSRDSRATFDEEPAFSRLSELCNIRYIFIDDLISIGVYGVTLTLAFARGILDSGSEQTNTHFIFMNSDFVLSDGALRKLVGELQKGRRCVMAPSLRAGTESVLPELSAAIDPKDGVLRMSSRQLVKLAFDHLHPTVMAKTVTQELVTCKTHNQIYWQVDRSTLLARYHLIFMLAIKPEVPLGSINSYCDYGFVPELVPSGEFTILDDSDDFFMLELQSVAQERELLTGGSSTPREIASELSVWTTREHRRFAEVDVLFHAEDLPADLASARTGLSDFMGVMQREMSTTPLDHVDHFYWVFGVQAWASLRFGGNADSDLPLEIARRSELSAPSAETTAVAPKGSLVGRTRRVAASLYASMLGRARMLAQRRPNVPIWHYLWLDCRLVLDWLGGVSTRPGQRNLLICSEAGSLASYFSKLPTFDVDLGLEAWLAESGDAGTGGPTHPDGSYDNVLIHMYRSNVREMRKMLEKAERLIKRDGTLSVYVDHVQSEIDPSNFSIELAQYVDQLLPSDWVGYRVSARFAGGATKRRLRLVERRLFRYLWPSSVWRLPLVAAAVLSWFGVAAMMSVSNLRNRNLTKKCPQFCSSFLASFSRPSRQPR